MSKSTYQERKDAGICVTCGKVPARPDKTSCEDCAVLNSLASKKSIANKPKSEEEKQTHSERTNEAKKQMRYNAIAALGGACNCCGERWIYYLDIDHINNDGNTDRASTGRWAFYKSIIEGLRDDVQVLCGNCHNAKTRNGRCNH